MKFGQMYILFFLLLATVLGALWYLADATLETAAEKQIERCTKLLRDRTDNNITYIKAKAICENYLKNANSAQQRRNE